jgi:gliding motility-associated-like protein
MRLSKYFFLVIFLFLLGNLFGQDNKLNSDKWNYSNRAFIENNGQFDNRNWNSNSQIEFGYTQNPFYIFFTKQGVTYRLDKMIKNPKHKEDKSVLPKRTNISELITANWIGSNSNIEIVSKNKTSNYFSYAIEGTSNKDVKNLNRVSGYKRLTYKNVYDNIDVEYTLHPEGGVKYNIILHPGADPSQIKLKYSTAHTNVKDEKINISLNAKGQLEINTSLGDIIEHKPVSFYQEGGKEIKSKYTFENNTLSFELENYDNSKKAVIDPWIVSPTYQTSTAAWEVETDGVGNVYSIGGESPMELKKYDINGNLQWTYVTPWDTSSVWLGTLATDANGTSYVTSGVTAEMHKVDNAGNFVWQTALSGGLQYNSEWWSITFNCDETQLIVGGTWVDGILSFDYYAGIFEIDVATGNVISDQTVDVTNIGGFGSTPVEVRAISSSKNAKYIFLTHNDVGAINQNFGTCPSEEPVFQEDNQANLGYKCENYLPETQNGGGLKALVANDNYFYTHSGDQIRQWDLTNGNLINTVALPGGASSTVPIIGGTVVENSGLDVDDCGNVYAGATNGVVKFDVNLNILSSSATSFAIYDVSVNSNGEVIACGAQQDNSATNRNGRIEALDMSACTQYTLVCCDANVCSVDTLCESDAPISLDPATAGGTWSGTGVDASGNFDPSVAGVGTHQITYTIPCGSETIEITVDPCSTLDICEESNGDLTVLDGTGPYTWEEEGTVNTPITNQTECVNCGYTWSGFNCLDGFTPVTECSSTGWTQFGTGTTVNPPSNYPIQVSDNAGATVIINNVSNIPACNTNPCVGVTIDLNIDSQTDVNCAGNNDGTATVSGTGGIGPYNFIWQPGSLSGASQSGLAPDTYTVGVQDDNGCTGSGTVTIGEPLPITLNPNSIDASCGATDGEVSVAPTGGTGGYSYNWSPGGQTTATVTNVGSGAYDITVTDGNGCTASATITVNTTNGPTISVDNSTDVSCFGENDGTAIVSASGGTPGYTYTWTPGGLTGDTQNALSPGTYNVQVEDTDGCTSTTTVTIGEPTEIDLSTSATASSCTVDDGSATVNASGGDGNYTYSWSPGGGASATFNNIGAGAYTVTVTDGNGCTAQEIVNVPSVNGPIISLDDVTDVSCFGESDGSAAISVTGGTPGFTYDWSPSGGTTPTENGMSGGSYTVTVEDAAGCISTETVTVNEPDQMVVNGNVVDAQCASSDGEISTNTTGGDGNYTYSWTPNGETTPSINGLSAGNYDITVTDGNGCTATGSYVVNQGDSIDVFIIPDNSTIQAGDEVAFNVTTNPTVTNPTYTWTPSDGLSCTNCQNPTASPNSTTTYTVVVTSDEGCVGAANAIINIIEPCADPFVPTIFSPNNDGKNDVLCIYGSCFQTVSLTIYNRWGEKIYETSSTEDCWDGTYRGKKVNSGTYVYKLRYNLFNEDENAQSGNITVVQ